MIRHKSIIFLLANIASIALSIQQIHAVPTCGIILGRDICIIGDVHGELDPEAPAFKAVTDIIDTFMVHERRKPYKTAIILELSPTTPLLSNGLFLAHIARNKPSPHSDVSLFYADQRDNVLDGFSILKDFLADYSDDLEKLSKENIKNFIEKREKIYTDYSIDDDTSVRCCIEDLVVFRTDVETKMAAIAAQSLELFNLLGPVYHDLKTSIDTVRRFFDFAAGKKRTKVLAAFLQRTIIEISLGIPNDDFDQIHDNLLINIFNMSAMLEICTNLQQGNRVVVVTGSAHAVSIIRYLTQAGFPLTYAIGFDHASLIQRTLSPEAFAELMSRFAALPDIR